MTDYRGVSLWLDQPPGPLDPRPHLPGDTDADVAIVGAGFTGLWTGYYLHRADPSLRIVVLERAIAGFGASGRNGGWCSALFPASWSRIAREHSRSAALAMRRAMQDSVSEVLAAAQREGIDCSAARGGTVTFARTPAQLDRARREVQESRAWGGSDEDLRLLNADEAGAVAGVTDPLGALYTPHCAAINPAALVRGLADRVEAGGVRLYERTAVQDIRPHRVLTSHGTVRAEVVVRAGVCTVEPWTDHALGCPTPSNRRSSRNCPGGDATGASRKGECMISAVNTTLILALFAVVALRPPMPRHSSPFNLQFALGWWINEAPFVGLWWVIAGTIGTLINPEPSWWWWLVAALTAVDVVLLGGIAVRARSARPALSEALRTVYGPRAQPRYTRPGWWRLLLPIVSWRPDVRRVRNRRYGPARRGNRLDVYVSRRGRAAAGPAPALVYFHGAFGSKMLGSHALIYRLATQGWVCVSAGRRQFRAGYSEQLADVRAVMAWVRDNARAYGGDPDRVFAAGGSAGAHLAATAAMTGSDVAGMIGLYGYYGSIGGGPGPMSPQQVINTNAPPFFIIHGTLDTLALPREARAFTDLLRAVSRRPVVYAELPGAQHCFDAFQSIRFHAVTDAIVRFAELTLEANGAKDLDRPTKGTRPGQS